MLKKLLFSGVILCMSAAVSFAAKWDMPTPYPDKTFHTVNIHEFVKDVKAATDGAIDIQVHSAGSLFKHPDIKNAVRSGQVAIGEFYLPLLGNDNPVFDIDSLPFLATSYDEATKLWKAQKETVTKLLDKQNMVPLYVVPWPPQCFYSKKPINSVKDVKGLKFRANSPMNHQLAKKLGMVPTQIEVPDIPQAFATGRVESMMTSPSTGANTKSWDYVKHYYDVRGWLPKNVVVVNKKVWRKLDEKTQQAVLDAAGRAEERGFKMSMAETDAKVAILKKEGMIVHSDDIDVLLSGMKKAGEEMLADWLQKADADGKAVIDAYNSLR
jgi:TRAP-type C4-dicarboxylate transport system substrate-binding protein